MTRRRLSATDLTAVLGPRHPVRHLHRLPGGSRKGVYRLTLHDDTTVVLYRWTDDENYWPDHDPDGPRPLDRFTTAHRRLTHLGIRVPDLLLLQHASPLGDIAVVEDIPGGALHNLPAEHADPVLRRLGDTVRAMHTHQPQTYATTGPAPERATLDRALADLADAATRVPRIAAHRQTLADTLHDRFTAVAPRRRHGLIHGELGPDHVLVDNHHRPVLIDIEDTRYADVESEHAFLEIRFGDGYRHLRLDDLDEARLALYRLALYLSLVAGPLRLLDGDFPDRAGMRGIVEQNITRTLNQLPRP